MESEMDQLRLRGDALRWREIEGELIAVDLSTSTYLSANSSGLLLWRALAEGACRDELVARLGGEFGIPRKTAEADVDSFLAEIEAHRLLGG
jgi:hypothetical protein